MSSLLNQECDYHMHSTASDGSLSPAALMAFAAKQGIKELALTDHDTFGGLAEASLEAKQQGIRLLPAMEFSCSWLGITIHLVALWPQGLTPAAHNLAALQAKARWSRAEQIIERLAKTSAPLELETVLQYSNGGVPGRPHFAEAMVAAGYVTNHSQAFRKWLGSGKLGDIKNHWKPLDEAVPWLIETGAFVSLAHPHYYKLTRTKRNRLVTAFAEVGGQAVEVVSGQQDPQQTQSLLCLIKELQLKVTWGSDFHSPGIICPAPGRYAALPEACVPLSQVFNL
ncbi:MAG: PHP domain-containing protein [Pseudomonadaceae bacterium]|nr:PHP domain-containing protein [Pseudomonadaceae bacterium]